MAANERQTFEGLSGVCEVAPRAAEDLSVVFEEAAAQRRVTSWCQRSELAGCPAVWFRPPAPDGLKSQTPTGLTVRR